MARILTDEEIAKLLQEPKQLARNWETRLRPLPKSNSKFTRRDCEINGKNGHMFRIIIRHNMINPLDFSIILVFRDEDGTEFNLRRYNGKHPSQHTNKLEKAKGLPNSSFRNVFHIHMATQRYQETGKRAEYRWLRGSYKRIFFIRYSTAYIRENKRLFSTQ